MDYDEESLEGCAAMTPDLLKTRLILERTPEALNGLLRGLPDSWTKRDEGRGTWMVYDIVGHLVYGERTNWMARVRWILEHGERLTFEAFDREAMLRECQGETLDARLDEFRQLRASSLVALDALHLNPTDLDRRGTHPRFGTVTLGQLLSTWATHDLTHLHQISRVLAHQYREQVGPWAAFLGVLRCQAHGD